MNELTRTITLVLWNTDKSSGQEPDRQPGGHHGMGLQFYGLPPDGGTAVEGPHESLNDSGCVYFG